MSKNWVRNLVGGAVLSIVVSVGYVTTVNAAANIDTSPMLPDYTYAHHDGSFTQANCEYANGYPATYAATRNAAGVLANSFVRQTSNDWYAPYCSVIGMTPGADSTLFAYQIKYTPQGFNKRLIAQKNNTMTWEVHPEACVGADAPNNLATIAYPTLGYDNTLYFIAYAPSGCAQPTNKLYAVNAADGQNRFEPISLESGDPGGSAQFDHIFPTANGFAVLDGKQIKQFDRYGKSLPIVTKTMAPDSGQHIIDAVGDNTGRIYVRINENEIVQGASTGSGDNCLGIASILYINDDASCHVIDSGQAYKVSAMKVAPDGLVTIGGSNTGPNTDDDVLVKYSLTGTQAYSVDLNQGFSQYNNVYSYIPQVDGAGNAYVASKVQNYYATVKDIALRKITPSGVVTMLFNTDTLNTPNGKKYATLNRLGLYNGGVQLTLCQYPNYISNTSCSQTGTSATNIFDNGNSDQYPRNEVLADIHSAADTDYDHDGLSFDAEQAQGTLDTNPDTDNDGLNDLIESTSNPLRQETFCNNAQTQCAYPNPLQKDIFIETDYVTKPGDNNGNGYYTSQPTKNQLAPIVHAFAAKNIKVHFDTGYLPLGNDDKAGPNDDIGNYGGGNSVPYYGRDKVPLTDENEINNAVSLLDYKRGDSQKNRISQYSHNYRYGVWRYLLLANKITDGGCSDGVYGNTIAGDDDTLVAAGLAAECSAESDVDRDNLLSKIIMHELGHELCLSDTSNYILQSPGCVSEKIDKNDDALLHGNYLSLMHYAVLNAADSYVESIFPYVGQLQVGYSDGTHGAGDHDDWFAIQNRGISDFSKQKVYMYIFNDPTAPCGVVCY